MGLCKEGPALEGGGPGQGWWSQGIDTCAET